MKDENQAIGRPVLNGRNPVHNEPHVHCITAAKTKFQLVYPQNHETKYFNKLIYFG